MRRRGSDGTPSDEEGDDLDHRLSPRSNPELCVDVLEVLLTVPGAMKSAAAISVLLLPRATQVSTSASRRVSPNTPESPLQASGGPRGRKSWKGKSRISPQRRSTRTFSGSLISATLISAKELSESTGAFSSGWHTHPGIAIVQVHKGYLKIYDQTCVPTIVEAGETYIETPERAVNVVGKGQIKWTTTLILANSAPGEPDRHPADNPCD